MSATERRLELLAVLQARPGITATALAERFAVSERTARRDVEHLRRIGYGIDGEAGRHGGYVLASSTKLPPLLLDADEAAAVALGLTGDLGVSGLELAAGTALAKVSELAPSRARGTLTAVGTAVLFRARPPVPQVVAGAARAGPCLSAGDVGPAAPARPRGCRAPPDRAAAPPGQDRRSVVSGGVHRRPGRLERVCGHPDHPGRPVRRPADRSPPPEDAAAFARAFLATGPRRHRVAVRLHTSADLARELVGPATGTIDDERSSCVLSMATDDLDWAARYLVYLNLDFDVLAPTALSMALHDLGDWLSRRHPE